jgi:DNA primase
VVELGKMLDGQKKDPDDLAREDPKLWRAIIKKSVSVYHFLIKAALAKHNPATPEGKKAIIKELAEPFSKIELEVERDFYLKKLAKKLNVKQALIVQDFKQQTSKLKKSTHKNRAQPELAQAKTSYRQKLESYIWFLFLRSDQDLIPTRINQLSAVNFDNKQFQLLFKKLKDFKPPFSLEKFGQSLPADLAELLFDLHLQQQYLTTYETLNLNLEWKKALNSLLKIDIGAKIKKITQQLDALDAIETKTINQEQQQQELLEKIVALKTQAQRFK